jgi:hypothetical protein
MTPINLRDEGATGQSTLADAPVIGAALDKMIAENRALYIPPGVYLSDRKYTRTTLQSFRIFGDGRTSVIKFVAADGGFDFTLKPQTANSPPHHAQIENVTIESGATVQSPAIKLAWSAYQPNAQGQARVANVDITRSDDGTGSFSAGFSLLNAIGVDFSVCRVLGDDARASEVAFDFADCVGMFLSQCSANRYQDGVRARRVNAPSAEGLSIQGCALFDVSRGINTENVLAVNVLNTHVNINGNAEFCARLVNCSQSTIGQGCLFYFGGLLGDPENQDCIIIDGGNDVAVMGCDLIGVSQPSQTRYGVHLKGGTTTSFLAPKMVSGAQCAIRYEAWAVNNDDYIRAWNCPALVQDMNAAGLNRHRGFSLT